MKLKVIVKTSMVMLSVVAVSCGPSAEEKAKLQSQREQQIQDSIARVEEIQKLEQQRQDSLRQEELKEMYKNVITVVVANKSKSLSTTCEGSDVTLLCTVTNNTDISLSAKDYTLSCTERYPVCSDGSSPDQYRPVPMKSVDLAPGESKSVTARANCTVDLLKPKVTLNMSEKEFLQKAVGASEAVK